MEEAASLLVEEDPHVKKGPWLFQVTDGKKILLERPACEVKDVKIFTDTHTCEVFINGGEQVVSFYFQP